MRILKSQFVLVSAAALALVGAATAAGPAPTAVAQPAPSTGAPIKIAIASPARIFTDMAEIKAVQEQMKAEEAKFVLAKNEKVKVMEDMKTRRDSLLPEHPQWTELNDQLSEKTVEYQVWMQVQKAKAENMQKGRFRALFKKIGDAVAEISKRDGIDLVLADNGDPLPTNLDEIDVPTVKGLLMRRDVIFASSRLDITQSVITLLDAKYRGVATAAPTGLPVK